MKKDLLARVGQKMIDAAEIGGQQDTGGLGLSPVEGKIVHLDDEKVVVEISTGGWTQPVRLEFVL